MKGTDILSTAVLACGYWATDADYDRVQPGKLVEAAREVVRQYPNAVATPYIKSALAENDPGYIDGEAADMILQMHLFGDIVYG